MVNERNEEPVRPARVAAAVVFAAVAVLTLAALGGMGFADTSTAAELQYGKVTICHKAGPHGKRVPITVSRNAVPAHLRHGDTMGPCPATAQKSKAKSGEKTKKQEAAEKRKAKSKEKGKPSADKGEKGNKGKGK
jgi:hypothetical protein